MSSNIKLKCVLVFYTLYCQVIKLNFIVANYVFKTTVYYSYLQTTKAVGWRPLLDYFGTLRNDS